MTARRRHRRLHRLDPLPADTKMVDRSSRWGNPYVFRPQDVKLCRPLKRTTELVADRATAVARYRADLEQRPDLAEWLEPLAAAAALACTCELDEACHADELLELLELHYPTTTEGP
jgi:hypothetical protein